MPTKYDNFLNNGPKIKQQQMYTRNEMLAYKKPSFLYDNFFLYKCILLKVN